MFETSRVAERSVDLSRRAGLFALSVGVHTLVVAAVIAASVASSRFPPAAPDEITRFVVVSPAPIPPPLGTPESSRLNKPAPPAPEQSPRAVQPQPNVTPAVIPGSTPSSDPSTASSETMAGAGATPVGSPDGVEGGTGDPASTATGSGDQPAVYQPAGEVRAASVLHRVQPEYPRAALLSRMSGTVTIRCIIDRDGRIRDPQILSSTSAMFNQPALDAVSQWRFAPGSMRGRPVDTWFELTIRFQAR